MDVDTAHFTQPDTVVPNPMNTLDWDRFQYVRANPINSIDPSGHTCIIYSNGAGSSCMVYQNATFDEAITVASGSYGISFTGTWKTQQKFTVLTAANDTGNMLTKYGPHTSQAAFKSTYRSINMKIGPCEQCNGAGGYTHSAHLIEFDSDYPFYEPTEYRSSALAFELSVHEVVHELGHAFANIGAYYDNEGYLHYRENSPYKDSYPDSRWLTDQGFAPGPAYGGTLWRQHPDSGEGVEDDIIRSHEASADMFLGHTYGVWANDAMGQHRSKFMADNMSGWMP